MPFSSTQRFKFFNYAVKINPPYKYINPKYGCKTYKIYSFGIMKFIVAAHPLQIHFLYRDFCFVHVLTKRWLPKRGPQARTLAAAMVKLTIKLLPITTTKKAAPFPGRLNIYK